MDSTTLTIIGVSLVLGIILNAMRFMRFIGFLTGTNKRSAPRRDFDSHLSFDERVAERLRELDRQQK